MSASENSQKTPPKSFMERILLETTIEYQLIDECIMSGTCKDLSVGGLYLRTKFQIESNETLMISFSIPDKERLITIKCKARVAWTNFAINRRKPVYPQGVGLQFMGLSDEDLFQLSKFIDEYDEHKKMNVICAWCGRFLEMRKGPPGTTSHGICSHCQKDLETSILLR